MSTFELSGLLAAGALLGAAFAGSLFTAFILNRKTGKAQYSQVITQLGARSENYQKSANFLKDQILSMLEQESSSCSSEIKQRLAFVLRTIQWPDDLDYWLEDTVLLNQFHTLIELAGNNEEIKNAVSQRSIRGLLQAYLAAP